MCEFLNISLEFVIYLFFTYHNELRTKLVDSPTYLKQKESFIIVTAH